MRFEDERYVRLYTRDTVTWKMLTWQGRCLFMALLRKIDRAGIIDLGEAGARGIAAIAELPVEVVEAGLESLLERDTIRVANGILLLPNFMAAQEARQSDRARQAAHRERALDLANARSLGVIDVGDDDEEPSRKQAIVSHAVTAGHATSRDVTLNRTVPCLAVPCLPREEPRDSPAEPSADGTDRDAAMPVKVQPGESGVFLASAAPAKRSKNGSRIAEDWKPSAAAVEWCRTNRVDASKHVDEFIDHWRSVSGGKGVKLDWDATFRNRIRALIDNGRAAEYVEVTPPTIFDVPVVTDESRQSALDLANKLEEFDRKRVIRG